jgi:hypothetical protein
MSFLYVLTLSLVDSHGRRDLPAASLSGTLAKTGRSSGMALGVVQVCHATPSTPLFARFLHFAYTMHQLSPEPDARSLN